MPQLDKHIRREDVQLLSGRDQVAAFFAGLGYQTDTRLTQSPANLGLTNDSLVRQITHLERLAAVTSESSPGRSSFIELQEML